MFAMTIDLPDELARALDAEVAAGRAKSVNDIVTAAVRAQLASANDLRRSLDEAEAEYDAIGGAAWSDVRAELNARLGDD
jgi:Arc/MetJ-type ribon-helix-helix transcriptional regulator